MTTQALPPVVQRNYTGWLFLGLLLLLTLVPNLFVRSARSTAAADLSLLEIETKAAIGEKSIAHSPKLAGAADKAIQKILDTVSAKRFNDPAAAEVFGVLSFELRKPVEARDVAALLKSKETRGDDAYRILTAKKLSMKDAVRYTADLTGNTFIGKLLKAEAFSKAGNPGPRAEIDQRLQNSTLITNNLTGLVVFISFGMWITFLWMKVSGNLPARGMPNIPATPFGADRLAQKALLFFAAYLLLMIASQLVNLVNPFSHKVGALLLSVATAACYPLVFRIRSGGGPLAPEILGIKRGSPWLSYLGAGLIAFIMEFPVSAIMAYVGSHFIAKNVTHPAEVELINSHDWLTVAALLLAASLLAPLFEETIFRGLLLPAITRLWGMAPSVLVTSLLFASLHPQGVGAWLGLGTIAAASCILYHQTGSLAPSIFMHCIHNSVTVVLVLLMS